MEFLLVSMCCDTAIALGFLLISVFCDSLSQGGGRSNICGILRTGREQMHHDTAYHYRLIEMQMAKENNQPTDKSAQGRFVAECVWVIKQRISGVSSVVT